MTDQAGRSGLRIVFVSEYFWPEIGGLERSTERLGAHLALLGHPVRMITQRLPGTAAREHRCGIDVYRWKSTPGVPFTVRAAAAGVFATADVVCLFGVGHDPEAAWWRPILDASLAPGGVRLLKVGTEGDIVLRGIPAELYRRLDGICCQTSGIAAEARQAGVRAAACHPVLNGLPLIEWSQGLLGRASARWLLGLPRDAFVVAGLGRFTHRKRFGDLVRAFTTFALAGPVGRRQPVLVLHGSDFGQDDSEEAELRKLAVGQPARRAGGDGPLRPPLHPRQSDGHRRRSRLLSDRYLAATR